MKNFFQEPLDGKDAIMLKKLLLSILMLLLVFIAGTFYLYQQKELSTYSPELARFLKGHEKHIAEGWRLTSGIRAFLQEMISKLQKYVPEIAEKKAPSSAKHDGRIDILSIFKTPPQQSNTVPEIVYTWVDKRGVRHFSDTKPVGINSKIETIRQ